MEYFNFHDTGVFYRILQTYKPDEVYNLGAQSHVRVSFDVPEETVATIAMGTIRLLEAIRNIDPTIKFYQASSSEMYGDNPIVPQDESTALMPASPYACAKVFAHNLVRNYRESYGLFATSGILFNHESPRRGLDFVTRKITDGVAQIAAGKSDCITLGNLEAYRDWGHAEDYVYAQWLMLQERTPQDFVIATGESYSVRDFLGAAFNAAGIEDYEGYVKQDPRFMRPAEVPYLKGNPSKAHEVLGWECEYDFQSLLDDMVEHDLDLYLT